MATDQFCLRWNNFQVNITSALESLKNDEDLVDVTLTCDGHNVKAHQVILSACSPYFRNIFKENPCQHPVVVLKDVKYEDVTALLNFMYCGEVYITQDRLASFLQTAELLQVRGLTGAANPFKDFQAQTPAPQPMSLQQPEVKVKKSCVPSQNGQKRRLTPPLSASPSAALLLPSDKVLKAPGGSLVSAILKASAKEKAKESTLSQESDVYLADKSGSQKGVNIQVLPFTVNSFTSNDQACSSYSSLNPELSSSVIPPAGLATFQMSNSNSSSHFSQGITSMGGHILTQPSSPSVTKRLKTLHRRFSSCSLMSGQTESLLNNPESTRLQDSQDSNESVDSDSASKDISVKVEELSGEELHSEEDQEEETSQCSQENLTDSDCLEFHTQKNDKFDHQILEQDVSERGGVRSIPSKDMLLCTVDGKPRRISQSDGSPSACSGSPDKMTTLPHVPQCGSCPHCGQTYSNQSALKYHVRLMHTDMTNRHCCHLCPRSFALRDVFKAHMWSKHKQRC